MDTRALPLYLAAGSSSAIAGEWPNGSTSWRLALQVEGGNTTGRRGGRDPTKIDICVRSYIYVTDDKKKAHREMSGYVPFGMHVLDRNRKQPEIIKLFEDLDRESPGIVDEMKRFAAAKGEFTREDGYDPWFEKMDAPYAKYMTQRIIDCIHLVGSVDEICEGINKLVDAGVTTVSTATYTIIDKKWMLEEVGRKIMPHFRS